jgi:Protein of unknown function (DUF1566)
MNNKRQLLSYIIFAMLACWGHVIAGELTPPGAPGATMHTLEEIYQKQVATFTMLESLTSLSTLSNTSLTVQAGYYAATTLDAVDTDLTAGNIKKNVVIFGVTGTLETAGVPVPATGQTTSYASGDDGAYTAGIAWPNPRFTVQANTNVVRDNLTGLYWARNANIIGKTNWVSALTYCEGLTYGDQSDWRLPNIRELTTLLDYGRYEQALPSGHPFINVQGLYYWSSTTDAAATNNAWGINFWDGNLYDQLKTTKNYFWPVRSGP